MDKQKAINEIEGLFPADAEYSDTAEIGQRLLEQARREINNWRNEPEAILFRYLELCQREENRQCIQK